MMRHGKLLAAVAAIVIALGVMAVLGTAARATWNTSAADAGGIYLTDEVLISGERAGDVAVFARAITIAPGGVVDGSAALVGERVQIDGRVTGDVSATASQIALGEGARIDGDAVLTGDTVVISGAVAGEAVITASRVLLGEGSALGANAQVCASAVTDQRVGAAPLPPCALAAPSFIDAVAAPVSIFLLLASVLAGGVLTALPHVLAPLRLARLDEAVRERKAARLLYGGLLAGLWLVGALLLTLLPAGLITSLLLIVVLGASFVLGAPLVWLGLSLAALWIGRPLLRLARRPRSSAPLAALIGGLLLSGLLALLGPVSAPGLLVLALMAVIGLAALGAARASGAVGDNPRRSSSYFVQG
jgi:cytoskeletal protein CcmA (bactofilin family)